MFQVMESLCIRGSAVPEDRMGLGENYLFVIDGASGLTDLRVTDQGSDAAWLAESLRLALERRLPHSDQALPCLLRDIAAQLKAQYDAAWQARGIASPVDYPTAGLAILRLREGSLEYLGLGDCDVVVQRRDGQFDVRSEDRLSALDRDALAKMAAFSRDTGCTMLEARSALNNLLIHNRQLCNHPEGYWIFDPTGLGLSHARQDRWPVEQIRSVSLLTDGFAQLVQPFGLAADLTQLHRQMEDQGLALLSQKLFTYQERDPYCTHYPRFKLRDDTTAIWALLQP